MISVDVRTATEFNLGHIPDSINLPLLNEEERAEVGTIYKEIGREKALERGLEIVSPKLPTIYKAVVIARRTEDPTKQSLRFAHSDVVIYCWRGGLRSSFVTSLLKFMGLNCQQLEGGYKKYRQSVLKQFESYKPEELLIIDGFTGCGKTKLLNELKSTGFPVVDLEALASHKGSVFGDIATPEQPTQQQFENNLAEELSTIEKQRPIILEGESQRIGFLQIPKAFFETMDKAPRLMLEESLENRVEKIYHEYIKPVPKSIIEDRIIKLEKRLGRERCKELIGDLRDGNDKNFVYRILNEYYDKTYMKSYKRRHSSGQPIFYSTNEKGKILNWLNSYSPPIF